MDKLTNSEIHICTNNLRLWCHWTSEHYEQQKLTGSVLGVWQVTEKICMSVQGLELRYLAFRGLNLNQNPITSVKLEACCYSNLWAQLNAFYLGHLWVNRDEISYVALPRVGPCSDSIINLHHTYSYHNGVAILSYKISILKDNA